MDSLAFGQGARQNGHSVTLEVVIDKHVAKGAAVAVQAIEATQALGAPAGVLRVRKA